MAAAKSKEKDVDGKFARYTQEQVEVLEDCYTRCPNPSSLCRLQLLADFPAFTNVHPRQLKVWFQNRRCRDKQQQESSRLVSLNDKLSAMNKVLVDENDHLSKQAIQLVFQNQELREHLVHAKNGRVISNSAGESPKRLQEQIAITTTEASLDSVVTNGLQLPSKLHPYTQEAGPASLVAFAEETLKEFLTKATGNALNWIQMPGMKPGPDSMGIVSIAHGCSGVAARTCGLVGLEPSKIAEVLKDRSAWLCDCRRTDVLGAFNTSSGGLLELLYTQAYSLTTLALPRDFCTLRYTSVLEDRNVVVCERTLPIAVNEMPMDQNFVRAEMFSSGILIRPYGSVGSIVHIVDHYDLKPEVVPEVLRPLFKSVPVLANRMTLGAMRYLRLVAREVEMDPVLGRGLRSSVIRTLCQRMSRGFNDAINSLSDDGWSPIANDGADDVSIAINTSIPFQLCRQQISLLDRFQSLGEGIICAKTSLLLQNVPPALLIRFLREHRSEWDDLNIGTNSVTSALFGGLGFGRGNACYGTSPLLLAHSQEQDEILELLRMEMLTPLQNASSLPNDQFLLQLCNGLEESIEGVSAQLVYAPVNVAVSEDMPLLSSGFRVLPLDNNLMDGSRTLDLTSTLEGGSIANRNRIPSYPSRSILTIAFQFPFNLRACDRTAVIARKYVRAIVASVLRIAMALAPSISSMGGGLGDLPGSLELRILPHRLLQSYRSFFGIGLLRGDFGTIDGSFEIVWQHPNAIFCCVWKSSPDIIFANQSALDMLETTTGSLQSMSWESTLDEQGRKTGYAEYVQVMQQGFSHSPCGIRISCTGRSASYERAVAWKVDCETLHCVAFMFINWSFQP